MISDSEVEKALIYMRDAAPELAEAKATRIYLEEFRKSKKAILRKEAVGCKTEGARDDFAYSHQDYLELLDQLKLAVKEEELFRLRFKAADARIEVYRTQSANARTGVV
ncbi:MAG: hypothetical protein O2797_02530 [Bacteroidetes bacterium]|nr:hypothetical protein [Bacteroidota bacterium]